MACPERPLDPPHLWLGVTWVTVPPLVGLNFSNNLEKRTENFLRGEHMVVLEIEFPRDIKGLEKRAEKSDTVQKG